MATVEEGIAAVARLDRPWEVDPERHAAALDTAAPPLAKRLRSSLVRSLAQEHALNDAEAAAAQASFKKVSSWTNALVGGATVLSSGVVAAALLDAGDDGKAGVLTVVVACVGAVLGAVATGLLGYARGGDAHELWTRKRANAEADRLEYFRAVALAEENDAPTRRLGLHYLMTGLLAGQMSWLAGAAVRHRESARRTQLKRAIATGVAAGSTALAGILATGVDADLATLAVAGTLAAALATFATNREALNQDRENAARYESTRRGLLEFERRFDRVDAAAAKGDADAVRSFVEGVVELLAADHRQWVELKKGRDSALDKLESALKSAEPAKPAG